MSQYQEPIWFAGPDIIASILLTGRMPKIEKAIHVVPSGKQTELGSLPRADEGPGQPIRLRSTSSTKG